MAKKPHLDDGGMILARAYAQLSTCRAIGMGGMGPIPITAVWEWENRNGIRDARVRRHIESVLGSVDAAALGRANRPQPAKSDTKTPAKPAATPPQRRRIAK